MIVRRATLADLSHMRAINISCLEENYPKLFWKEAIESGAPHFVVSNGASKRPVGYLATMDNKDTVPSKFMVYSFAVVPNMRGRGLGKQLLAALLDVLESYGRDVWLNVRVSNAAAIKLYKDAGFKETRVIPGYYSCLEDAFEMILKNLIIIK